MNTQFSHNTFKFDLRFEPVGEPVVVNQGKTVTVLYLARDTDPQYPFCPYSPSFFDGYGEIFTLHPNETEHEHQDCLRHQQNDVDAVLLDCDQYSYSCKTWSSSKTWSMSIANFGINDRFDAEPAPGVWIPDESVLKQIDLKVLAGIPRREAVLTFAQLALGLYNSWSNGECYGVIQDVFELDSCGNYRLNDDTSESSFGFYGYCAATEELNSLIPTDEVVA
jgi:hypothetical protein